MSLYGQSARLNKAATAPIAPIAAPVTPVRSDATEAALFAVDAEPEADAVPEPDALLDVDDTDLVAELEEPVLDAPVETEAEPSAAAICASMVELNSPDMLLSWNLAEKTW